MSCEGGVAFVLGLVALGAGASVGVVTAWCVVEAILPAATPPPARALAIGSLLGALLVGLVTWWGAA